MLEYAPLWWLAAIIVFCVGEAVTVQMISIWFGAGALLALISSMLGAQGWVQVGIFFVGSAVMLIATRPLVKKLVGARKTATNADMVVGATGIVQEPIDNVLGAGRVYVNGLSWSARSEDGAPQPEGEKVLITRIEGNKVYVKPVNG
ncbi:MAG: NfeD family protein [Acetanaerobacterium sp.]